MAFSESLQSFGPSVVPELEIAVRHRVAAALGVSPEEIAPETSLFDDLAIDSLDLVELAIVLEDALDVVLPSDVLAGVRTYGDLLDVAGSALRPHVEIVPPGVVVRSRLVGPPPAFRVLVQRSGALTPYIADTIIDDALGAETGATLLLTVAPKISDPLLGWLRRRLARLDQHGIKVRIQRDYGALTSF